MTQIDNDRTEDDLTSAELHQLLDAEKAYEEAVNEWTVDEAMPGRGIEYDPRIDLSRVPVDFKRYWIEHRWLALQETRARLGMSWMPAETGERTANGKVLAHGMRVFTNNLDRGVVDLSRAHWSNARDGLKSLWFDVLIDETYDGKKIEGRRAELQNAERVTTRFQGKDA